MTTEYLNSLLADADRVVATDLYPARCRTVIAYLAAALRSATAALTESHKYGLAMEQELAARAAIDVRFTWAKDDEEFWLHMKLPDGKAAGINLGNPKTMIATACLRALVDGQPSAPERTGG